MGIGGGLRNLLKSKISTWSSNVAKMGEGSSGLKILTGKLLTNILLRKDNWIGHILRRNCLLHDTFEGQMMGAK